MTTTPQLLVRCEREDLYNLSMEATSTKRLVDSKVRKLICISIYECVVKIASHTQTSGDNIG